MEILRWVIIAVLVAVSVFSIVLCLFRGRGASHKMLLCSIVLLGAAALVCFVGDAVLACFGMGWRCTLFNNMLLLCVVLLIATLCCCMSALCHLEGVKPALIQSGVFSMILVILITVMSAFFYFMLSSWSDGLTTYDGQVIVYETNGHGSFGAWRYYTHINDLVHGAEIKLDGWYLAPPRQFH